MRGSRSSDASFRGRDIARMRHSTTIRPRRSRNNGEHTSISIMCHDARLDGVYLDTDCSDSVVSEAWVRKRSETARELRGPRSRTPSESWVDPISIDAHVATCVYATPGIFNVLIHLQHHSSL